MTYRRLKIRLLLMEHKIPTWIAIFMCLSIFVCYCWNHLDFSQMNFSTDAIGMIGSLLGALIGGFFTLVGSIGVAKNQQKAQREILRKNIIYKPLYDELNQNDRLLTETAYYPTEIEVASRDDHSVPIPSFCIWEKIRYDNRLLETPKEIISKMKTLRIIADDFVLICNRAERKMNNIWVDIWLPKDDTSSFETFMPSGMLPLVLWSNKREAIEWLNKKVNGSRRSNDNDIKNLAFFYDCCQQEESILEVDEMKKLWVQTQREVIELLAMHIKYVNSRYEG